MIVVGYVGRGRRWSTPCRSPRFGTRRALAPVTPEAGEVDLSLLRPVRG